MFHPFSSINTALSKSIQVRPVLYFTAKMGATSVKKSSTGNMITIKLGENISLNLHLNAGLIGSLPIADNAIQLGSSVKYLFEFHYMLCNPHAHLSIGVFAIAQFGFYFISPKMISILFIGYVYCCVYYLYSSKQTSLDLVIFAVYRQSHGDHRTFFFIIFVRFCDSCSNRCPGEWFT